MEHEIFADCIGSIVLEKGVMRLDLMAIMPGPRDKDSKPQMGFRQRIVMPLEGFLDSYKLFQEVIGKMEQSGLISRQPAGVGGSPAAAETSAPAVKDPGGQSGQG